MSDESPLNQHQRHHVAASCQYIDRLLGDIETAAAAASTNSPFNKYIDDLTPEQRQLVREYCREIRARMVAALERHGADIGGPAASARHAIRTAVGLVDVAAEEIRPQYMRGYGAMSEAALPELHALATELQTLTRRFDAGFAVDAPVAARSAPPRAGDAVAGAGTHVAPGGAARAAGPPIDMAAIEAELTRAAGMFEEVRKVCEAQRDPPQLVLTEALDLAAERAATALDYPDSMPGGVPAAVRAAIEHVAADNADDVRRPLGLLIERARAALASAARAARVAEAAAPDDWSRLMREMPAFALGDVAIGDVKVPLRKMLGKSVAFSRLRAAIAAQAGERVEQALAAHGLALHHWSLRVWHHVRDDFQTRADLIRSTPEVDPGGRPPGSASRLRPRDPSP